MEERRALTRQKSFLQGRLYFNHRRSSVDCLVRDLSENGARLKFSDSVATPDIVELHIPTKDESFRAHVIWRLGDEVGVCFGKVEAAQQETAGAQAGDLTGRVQTLENELISLRRLFAEMRAEVKQIKQARSA